jgi:TonB family protein
MDAFCCIRGKFMRNFTVIAMFALMVTGFSSGQQATQATTNSQADAQPAPVKVYAVGPDVTAPELQPLNLSLLSTEKCRNKLDGKVVLSLLVDATGKPRNLMFLKPLGNDLDKYALEIVDADRFNPGIHDGAPVVVGQTVEVNIHACVEQTNEDVIKKTYRLRLRSQPEQKFGDLAQAPKKSVLTSDEISRLKFSYNGNPVNPVRDGISPPVPLISPEAEFSDDARRAKYQGTCLISLTVDRNGLPRNLRVVKPLDYGLTEQSIEAVKRYRFKPAMKNGEPVPVEVNIEVSFHIG